MIVSIHQPQYMPWLGYFDKIARADLFVLLDDVQYKKNEWQNRNLIKTPQGTQWITVPVRYHFPEKINEVLINNTVLWQKKQKHCIEMHYAKSAFLSTYRNFLEFIFESTWERIDQLNINMVKKLSGLLGITTTMVCSSELKISSTGTQRLIDICGCCHADTYIAGQGGEQYMDVELFARHGITVTFQKYEHPRYPQLYGAFVSHLSVLDLLFNCGTDSLRILRGAA